MRQAVLNKLIDSDNDTGDEDCSDEEQERILKKVNRQGHQKAKPASVEQQMKLKKFHVGVIRLQRMQQIQ